MRGYDFCASHGGKAGEGSKAIMAAPYDPVEQHSIVQRLLKSLRNKAANKLFTPPGAVTTATLLPGSVDGSGYRGPDPSTALSPARASKALTQYGSVDLGSSATTAIR